MLSEILPQTRRTTKHVRIFDFKFMVAAVQSTRPLMAPHRPHTSHAFKLRPTQTDRPISLRSRLCLQICFTIRVSDGWLIFYPTRELSNERNNHFFAVKQCTGCMMQPTRPNDEHHTTPYVSQNAESHISVRTHMQNFKTTKRSSKRNKLHFAHPMGWMNLRCSADNSNSVDIYISIYI